MEQDKELAVAERILARQMAYELTEEEQGLVAGGRQAGSSYTTCSGGQPDACDID